MGVRMPEIKGIVFDLGGVIVDSFEFSFYDRVAKDLGISAKRIQKTVSGNWALMEVGGETNLQFWNRMAQDLKLDNPLSGKLLAKLWLDSYVRDAKILKAGLALAKKLRQRYPLGVISNTQHEHVAINKKRKLFDNFDALVLSSEVGLRKPQEGIFQLVSKKLGIPAKYLLFIDDDARWVRVAKEYGFQAILYRDAPSAEVQLKKMGIL